jgi:hypothetical protein
MLFCCDKNSHWSARYNTLYRLKIRDYDEASLVLFAAPHSENGAACKALAEDTGLQMFNRDVNMPGSVGHL